MKALTICQPYAELIARGEKRVENRTWPTLYRGPLAIHAGKSREWLDGETDAELLELYGCALEFGAVVATCTLADCIKLGDIQRGHYGLTQPWLRSHEHTNGPYCFLLLDVKRLDRPIPYRGMQGLWECSAISASGDSE